MDAVELYDPDNHWRHRHPLEKALFAGGMLMLAVALQPGIITALLLLLMTAAALVGARVSWRRFLGGLAVPAGFLLTGTLPILVSIGWEKENVWPTLTLNGVAAGRVFVRGLAATSCLIFFATTTSLPDILGLLRVARCPEFLVELMMLTYRFALALVQTARSVRLAQRLRLGYISRRAEFRSFGLLATNLLPRSLELAKRLARGLETRGYDGQLPVLFSARQLSWPLIAAILGVELALAGLGIVAARGGA
jgi:cobalt/nickel transport system permease protein